MGGGILGGGCGTNISKFDTMGLGRLVVPQDRSALNDHRS